MVDAPIPPAEPPADPVADYGEVFTRRWVVELMLDLVGYTSDHDLAGRLLVEPSCGTGAFLLPAVDRLINSCMLQGRELSSISGAVQAFDLLEANAERARKAVALRLQEAGMHEASAVQTARAWIITGDFLLHDHRLGAADYVIGNPPYIRLESVPQAVMEAYRKQCPSMRGRSDIYVGFFERGLELLKPGGSLGFICADRWMHNQYGANLRELITGSYAVDTVITMHDVDAFEDDVSAYPAIVVLRNGKQESALIADANGHFGERDSHTISRWAADTEPGDLRTPTVEATRVHHWFQGRDLWPAGTPTRLALIAELEARYPPLQDPRTGTRVGIGVATGCDEVYITTNADLVEQDRLLPLLQTNDIASGVPSWSGTYLVNPWNDAGLVDLDQYPRLTTYLKTNAERLRARYISRKRPSQWYRTIDRVDPKLASRPKLVLPDLKGAAHPVLDDGNFYPHHNLYFVVSDTWDLEALGGLLLSDIANLFVGAYCVKMRGGCYRFQAQYLRRIRVPDVEAVSRPDRRSLASAFAERDVEAATATALKLYGLDRTLLTQLSAG